MPFNAAVAIPRFRGLANNLDRAELTFENLKYATNLFLDDAGWPHVRIGWTELGVSNVDALHISQYKQKGYYIAAGNLYDLESQAILKSGVGSGPYYFTDAGSRTYFNSSSGSWYCDSNSVLEWGLEVPPATEMVATSGGSLYEGIYRIALAYYNLQTGAVSGTLPAQEFSVANGGRIIIPVLPQKARHGIVICVSKTDGSVLFELARTTLSSFIIDAVDGYVSRPYAYINRYPPPLSGPICFHAGRIYVAMYDDAQDFTSIFGSERNAFGFYNLTGDSDYDELGKVFCLISLPHGMVVGKDFEIVYLANDGQRIVLAPFGVVPGNNFDYDQVGQVYLTTQRGIYRLGGEPLFENANEEQYLTNWGESCGSGFVKMEGTDLFITCPVNSNVRQDYAGEK